MELTKVKGQNSYIWTGLTLGKLMAIKNELGIKISETQISPVAYDLLRFLEAQGLDQQDMSD